MASNLTKTELKNKILEILRDEELGMTKTRLSERLDASRQTVSKYVDMLQEEGLIEERRLGNLKYWAISRKNLGRHDITVKGYQFLIDSLLRAIEDVLGPEDEDWKRLMKSTSDHYIVEKIIDTEEIVETFENYSDEPMLRAGAALHKIMVAVMEAYDTSTVEEPVISIDPPLVTMKIIGSQFTNDVVLRLFGEIIKHKVEPFVKKFLHREGIEFTFRFVDIPGEIHAIVKVY